MNLSLENKTAVVCGSTQGIGLASAKELALLGANCVLVARSEDKLKLAVAELSNNGTQNHGYMVADFSKPEELKSIIEEWAKENQANILVNNTGGPKGGPIHAAEISEFTNTFQQHLICNHIMVQALMEGMKAAGYGRIVNIISTSVKQPLDGLGVSNTIRGAVANWSKTLANELGQFNITVNNVLPGATNTIRLSSIIENKAEKTGGNVEDIKEGMANQSPMKRIAEPEEVANAVAFLCSPAASYINGINVPVDGGRTKSL
ncbi:3-oxoacyl-[acyl-carrier protein] reductase [Lishizhenia tianjinensis]|uniref:3-oxoacyl-[acyl-carrier protein] reductase n=1 Tax=Lishizhenia tianjinensis TaxID=477690 RepID=A0A1I7AWS3_9FLAO|nr:SDR family oxidoreductase [Lishizhenia tianjinensis]SFT79344.1 3-oxoacyl-[acyl-carrier protein] reductase [Lishizhenia tianjinensis]